MALNYLCNHGLGNTTRHATDSINQPIVEYNRSYNADTRIVQLHSYFDPSSSGISTCESESHARHMITNSDPTAQQKVRDATISNTANEVDLIDPKSVVQKYCTVSPNDLNSAEQGSSHHGPLIGTSGESNIRKRIDNARALVHKYPEKAYKLIAKDGVYFSDSEDTGKKTHSLSHEQRTNIATRYVDIHMTKAQKLRAKSIREQQKFDPYGMSTTSKNDSIGMDVFNGVRGHLATTISRSKKHVFHAAVQIARRRFQGISVSPVPEALARLASPKPLGPPIFRPGTKPGPDRKQLTLLPTTQTPRYAKASRRGSTCKSTPMSQATQITIRLDNTVHLKNTTVMTTKEERPTQHLSDGVEKPLTKHMPAPPESTDSQPAAVKLHSGKQEAKQCSVEGGFSHLRNSAKNAKPTYRLEQSSILSCEKKALVSDTRKRPKSVPSSRVASPIYQMALRDTNNHKPKIAFDNRTAVVQPSNKTDQERSSAKSSSKTKAKPVAEPTSTSKSRTATLSAECIPRTTTGLFAVMQPPSIKVPQFTVPTVTKSSPLLKPKLKPKKAFTMRTAFETSSLSSILARSVMAVLATPSRYTDKHVAAIINAAKLVASGAVNLRPSIQIETAKQLPRVERKGISRQPQVSIYSDDDDVYNMETAVPSNSLAKADVLSYTISTHPDDYTAIELSEDPSAKAYDLLSSCPIRPSPVPARLMNRCLRRSKSTDLNPKEHTTTEMDAAKYSHPTGSKSPSIHILPDRERDRILLCDWTMSKSDSSTEETDHLVESVKKSQHGHIYRHSISVHVEQEKPRHMQRQKSLHMQRQQPPTTLKQQPPTTSKQQSRHMQRQQPPTTSKQQPHHIQRQQPPTTSKQQPRHMQRQQPRSTSKQHPRPMQRQRPRSTSKQQPRPMKRQQQPTTSKSSPCKDTSRHRRQNNSRAP